MSLIAKAQKNKHDNKNSAAVAASEDAAYLQLGDISATGRVQPTSNNSGKELFADNYYDYIQTGQKLVSGNADYNGRVKKFQPVYQPIYTRVGRTAGSSAPSDVQPQKSKRSKDPRASSKSSTQKGENRRASTILTGSQGLLGNASGGVKTLLGG